MSTLLQDVRYGVRSLAARPGFAAVAVLTLALGIGANTAIFSVIRSVLLRPLPFRDPDRLVELWETRRDRGWDHASFTHANVWDVQARNRAFEGVGAMGWTSLNLTGFDYPEQLGAAEVSAGFFRVLGVTPVAGRTFLDEEGEPGHDTHVALLGHRLWVARFGADPAIVGRTLTLDGAPYTVVGVLPAGTPWLDAADLFVPLLRRADADRGSFELAAIGRLKPGVSMDAARADLERVARALAAEYPDADKGMGIGLGPSSAWVASDSLRRALWILMGAVGFLLLIACVNLTNLFLAKGQGDRVAEVVGLVGDLRERGLDSDPTRAVYLPYYGSARSPVQIVVHTSGLAAHGRDRRAGGARREPAPGPLADRAAGDAARGRRRGRRPGRRRRAVAADGEPAFRRDGRGSADLRGRGRGAHPRRGPVMLPAGPTGARRGSCCSLETGVGATSARVAQVGDLGHPS